MRYALQRSYHKLVLAVFFRVDKCFKNVCRCLKNSAATTVYASYQWDPSKLTHVNMYFDEDSELSS